MFLIFLGPPGAGKGTQAKIISQKLSVPHISTGELFRSEMSANSDLGKRITSIMDSGKLVDDKTTMKVFEKRLMESDCSDGAVLDGIPRTIAQAKLLEKLFSSSEKTLNNVIYINLPKEEIISRITGRRTCKQCGKSYHIIFNPPKAHGICDLDGSPLFQREDQKLEAVQKRIEVYQTQTAPLIEYYKGKGLLVEIDGQLPIDEVTSQILEKLNL